MLREGDEIGLHVHCDNHLLYSAGVAPKRYPSWNNLPDFTGHSVPLSAFTEEEVRQTNPRSPGDWGGIQDGGIQSYFWPPFGKKTDIVEFG